MISQKQEKNRERTDCCIETNSIKLNRNACIAFLCRLKLHKFWQECVVLTGRHFCLPTMSCGPRRQGQCIFSFLGLPEYCIFSVKELEYLEYSRERTSIHRRVEVGNNEERSETCK